MSSTPQFGTAEYKSGGGDVCLGCKQPLAGSYYRVNGKLACERCVQQVKQRAPQDSHSNFVRGIVFGIGGAILGLILYSAFTILTGIIIGYVSLAVGWLVGTAIKKGSQGVGGRRYQVAAVALTYAAVSLSAIPIGISFYLKNKKPATHAATSSSAAPAASDSAAGGGVTETPAAGARSPKSPGAIMATLLFAGLASPFLELQSGFSGLIGLVILFVGIRIAWKMTAAPPLTILGPFEASTPPPEAAPTT